MCLNSDSLCRFVVTLAYLKMRLPMEQALLRLKQEACTFKIKTTCELGQKVERKKKDPCYIGQS